MNHKFSGGISASAPRSPTNALFQLSQYHSRAAVAAHVAPSGGVEGATAHGNHVRLRGANEGVGRQTPQGVARPVAIYVMSPSLI